MLTKTHLTEEHKSETIFGSEDKHYFLDFDLSYLGSNSDSKSSIIALIHITCNNQIILNSINTDYTLYALRIREEYEFMSESTYKIIRAKVTQII